MKRMILLGLSAFVVVAIGCRGPEADTPSSRDDARDDRPPATAEAPDGAATESTGADGAALRLSQGSPSYLVDGSGASMYFLEGNAEGTRCDATCEQAWPPVVAGGADAGTGVQVTMIGRLERQDGRSQLTYGRQPLYRYAGDAGAGRTSGHGVRDRWGTWQLMAPDGRGLEHVPAADNPQERAPPAAEDAAPAGG